MATDGKHDTIVQEAINRVLAAERDATQAVARCEEQAKQELEAAREAAQRVRLRARQRVVVLLEVRVGVVAKLAAALTGSDE